MCIIWKETGADIEELTIECIGCKTEQGGWSERGLDEEFDDAI